MRYYKMIIPNKSNPKRDYFIFFGADYEILKTFSKNKVVEITETINPNIPPKAQNIEFFLPRDIVDFLAKEISIHNKNKKPCNILRK